MLDPTFIRPGLKRCLPLPVLCGWAGLGQVRLLVHQRSLEAGMLPPGARAWEQDRADLRRRKTRALPSKAGGEARGGAGGNTRGKQSDQGVGSNVAEADGAPAAGAAGADPTERAERHAFAPKPGGPDAKIEVPVRFGWVFNW